jgi:predicted phage baseplate assembly protein
VRARTRAVTAEDFEYLALEASSMIARAKCLTAGTTTDGENVPAGMVRLLIVPKVGKVDKPIPKDELEVPKHIRDEVQTYLDERRLLGTRLEIGTPDYRAVSVEASIKIKTTADQEEVLSEAKRRLYRYINPVLGGPDSNGWPFGRTLSVAEIFGLIQGTPDVNYVEDIKLFTTDPKTGERQEAGNRIIIPLDSLICSQEHKVTAVAESEWEKELGR